MINHDLVTHTLILIITFFRDISINEQVVFYFDLLVMVEKGLVDFRRWSVMDK